MKKTVKISGSVTIWFTMVLVMLQMVFLVNVTAKESQAPVTGIANIIKQAALNSSGQCATITLPPATTTSTVLDFGAKPNDDVNDSPAFQKMIDNGSDLIIPAGTYNISSTILLSGKHNLQIIGKGVVNLVTPNKTGAGVFSVSDCTGVLISNINCIGGVKMPDNKNIAINLVGKNNTCIGVLNSKFTGTANSGFNIGINMQYGASYIFISGCTFDSLVGTTSGNGYGIHIALTLNAFVCNNNFTGAPGRGRHAVYLSTGAQNCTVLNNVMKDFEWSAIVFNCYSYQVENKNNLVQGNTIMGCARTPYWGLGQINVFGKCNNNSIVSNKLSNSGKMGIFVSGNSGSSFGNDNVGFGTKITNNSISNSSTYGITISGSNNVEVSGNIISNAGISDVKGRGFSAIYISANLYDKGLPPSHDISLIGNTVSGKAVTRSAIFTDKVNGSKNPYNILLGVKNLFPKLRVSDVE